jgi:hypothetical protein
VQVLIYYYWLMTVIQNQWGDHYLMATPIPTAGEIFESYRYLVTYLGRRVRGNMGVCTDLALRYVMPYKQLSGRGLKLHFF